MAAVTEGGPATGDGGVAERLAAVRLRIAASGGDPGQVVVVAVTKGFGPEAVGRAAAAGLADVGENYADELVAKHDPALRWHFLGAVQRRKVARLAPLVAVWQGVDRPDAGAAIARHAPGARVLVQVNVTGAVQRNGCSFEEVPALVAELRDLGLDVGGLMAVGPQGPPEGSRPHFARVAETAAELGLRERSMGMSSDLEVAVQEGATMVRLGTALFGPRPQDRRQTGGAE